MIWTVSPHDATCGSCSRVIPAGQPIQLLTVKQLIRCVDHATGPVNEAEVDLERARLEMDLERDALRRGPETSTPAPVHRHRLLKPLKPASAVGPLFDAKTAAVGERE